MLKIEQIEDIVLKALEENKPEKMFAIPLSDIKEDLFGDGKITDLVKKIITKKDEKLFAELKKIQSKSTNFSEEEEEEVNFSVPELTLLDLYKQKHSGLTHNFSEEFSRLLVNSHYRNKPMPKVLQELKAIGFQFSQEVASLTEIAILDPSRVAESAEKIEALITEVPFPYKTNVKVELVDTLLNAAFSKEDFDEAYENFRKFISNKSLADIQTIQAHFSKLNVIDLAKGAVEGQSADLIREGIVQGEKVLLSALAIGDLTSIGQQVYEMASLNKDEATLKMYPSLSAYFSGAESLLVKLPSNTESTSIKTQEFSNVGKISDLTEGTEFVVDTEENKGKKFRVLSVIAEGKLKVTDGTDEYELTLEEGDEKLIKIPTGKTTEPQKED